MGRALFERFHPCLDPSPPSSGYALSRCGAGKSITTAAVELEVSPAAIRNRVRQDQIDRGKRPGITTPESFELAKAKKRIGQLETKVQILKVAAKLMGEDRPGRKGFTR